ncbi:hypothetical protein [Vibrio tasmaniensis]|uniref:hypothetical protein n=1 Tax=Vibrio tasmaniensis TaxID=212663 RepID=UPI00107F3D96|nr:hypothetical protein [Vibrio tasmaniensis]|tara:strand:+ start:3241 stop:3801 length:561 start_codon:yes stop_codon:yes gene_type:complete
MPLTEIKQIIQRFKDRKDDTPIALGDTVSRVFALHELLSICASKLHLFVFFDEHGESDLFEMLSDDKSSHKLSKFLDRGDVYLLTNDTGKVKALPFIERLSESAAVRLHIKPLPNRLGIEYQTSKVDNEYVLASPEHLIFLGKYAGGTERLSEVRAFLNLYDREFYKTLLNFFVISLQRAERREFE